MGKCIGVIHLSATKSERISVNNSATNWNKPKRNHNTTTKTNFTIIDLFKEQERTPEKGTILAIESI
jgi:hypothetical protein